MPSNIFIIYSSFNFFFGILLLETNNSLLFWQAIYSKNSDLSMFVFLYISTNLIALCISSALKSKFSSITLTEISTANSGLKRLYIILSIYAFLLLLGFNYFAIAAVGYTILLIPLCASVILSTNKKKFKLWPAIFFVLAFIPVLNLFQTSSQSKREVIVPLILSIFLFFRLYSPRLGTSNYKRITADTTSLIKFFFNVVRPLLAAILILYLIVVLQGLRAGSPYEGDVIGSFINSPSIFFSSTDMILPSLGKLTEATTLTSQSVDYVNLISSGKIKPFSDYVGPLSKLFGIGLLPFTGSNPGSYNNIYTGFVDYAYRLAGGSMPIAFPYNLYINFYWLTPFAAGVLLYGLNRLFIFISIYTNKNSVKLLFFQCLFLYFCFQLYRGTDPSLAVAYFLAQAVVAVIVFLLSSIPFQFSRGAK